ncbi:MAG: transglycosylase domain-containing protein [Bacteroidota bacterium]
MPDAPPPADTTPSSGPRRFKRIRRAGRGVGRYVKRLFSRDISHTRRFFLALGGLVGTGLTLTVLTVLVVYPFTPSLRSLKQMKVQAPTVVRAASGEELTRFQRLNQEWVSLDEVSPHVTEALVATEDHRFYRHPGVDIWRLGGSVIHTMRGDQQGGSTLTMQLARNLYPRKVGRASTITRKLREIVTALKIEAVYEKDEILETYLNTVPFLYNAYGIEMAARTYFSTSAAELDVLQAATLVGMLKGTNSYNPVRRPERSQARRNVVLNQMVKRDLLDADEAAALRERPLRVQFERQRVPGSRAPHFTAYVRRQLEAWADDEGYDLYTDGLVVHTTLDLPLQTLAEQAVTRQGQALQAVADVEWSGADNPLRSASPHDYLSARRQILPFAHFWSSERDLVDRFVRATPRYQRQRLAGADATELLAELRRNGAFMDSLKTAKTRLAAGFVGLDPRTGQVKAWVGSRSYARDQYDKVAQARRQPGSIFKPFVYAAALERGHAPTDRFPDTPVEIQVGRDQIWRPVNAGGFSGEDITLRTALATSNNAVTARLIDDVGVRRTARLAQRMGVTESPLERVPSLALGTSPVTLLEMASAYATIASGGMYRTPLVITHIEDADGQVLATFDAEPRRVLSEDTAHALTDMLRSAIDEGTGQRIRRVFGVRADVAGKTGTTQDNADGWFMLMHPHLVGGAWVGFNDPRVRFRSDYWGQGAHNALYVVGDVFRHALRQGRLDPRPALGPVLEEAPAPTPAPSFWEQAGTWVAGLAGDVRGRWEAWRTDEAIPVEPLPRVAEATPPTPRAAGTLLSRVGDLVREVDSHLEDASLDLDGFRPPDPPEPPVAPRSLDEVNVHDLDLSDLDLGRLLGRVARPVFHEGRFRMEVDHDELEHYVDDLLDAHHIELTRRERAELNRTLRQLAQDW